MFGRMTKLQAPSISIWSEHNSSIALLYIPFENKTRTKQPPAHPRTHPPTQPTNQPINNATRPAQANQTHPPAYLPVTCRKVPQKGTQTHTQISSQHPAPFSGCEALRMLCLNKIHGNRRGQRLFRGIPHSTLTGVKHNFEQPMRGMGKTRIHPCQYHPRVATQR